MKSKISLCATVLAVAAASAFALGVAKEEAPANNAANASKQKPTLVIDSSPIAPNAKVGVTSYADVVEPVQKAVVSVYSTKIVRQRVPTDPFFRQFFGLGDQERQSKEEGLGSGVIISPDGYILTNNHVVEGADELNVLLPDERELKAKVIGADPKTDIAVIKIEAENLPVLTLADSDKLRVGDVVFAVGNPLGIGQTVTMGIVSAKGRSIGILDEVGGYEDFIQTDAAINMGNSGGALVDAKGRLVGINSAIISTTRGNIGIGLAVPVNLATTIMNSLITTGTVSRGFLGIVVDPITPDLAETLGIKKDTKGVVITDVQPDTPAAKAGLKREDVILSIDGKNVPTKQELRLLVSQKPPDTVVKVKYLRGGKENTVDVKLGKLTDAVASDDFIPGVTVSPITDDLRRNLRLNSRVEGLVITNVDAESPFGDKLRPGMVILEVNRTPVKDLNSAREALKPGRNLLLVQDRGGTGYVPFTMP
jgi:Do/DeqQ family serine protease